MLMRKVLLSVMMLAAAGTGLAQTKDSPLTMTEGENSYAVNATQATVYWKYTAGKDALVTLKGASGDAGSTYVNKMSLLKPVTGAAADSVELVSTASDKNYNKMVAVKAGDVVLVESSTYGSDASKTRAGFTVEADTDVPGIGTGLSESTPLVIVSGKTQFIGDQTASGVQAMYLTYTATEDGLLTIVPAGYPNSITVNGTPASTSYSAVHSRNELAVSVTAGQTYNIRWSIYGVTIVTSELTHPEPGSVDMPFQLVSGDNEVPAEKGVYYYTVTPGKTGYAVFGSDSGIPGGKVEAYASQSDLAYNRVLASSEQGELALRFEVTSATAQYYLKVTKVEDTDESQVWTYACEDYKQGEKESNPIEVASLPASGLSAPQGTTYYRVTVPAGKVAYLVAEVTATVSSAATTIKIYPEGQSWNSVSGQQSAKAEADGGAAGAKYMVCVSNAEGAALAFRLYLEDIRKGDLITNPLTAQQGSNTIDRDGTVYYQYTASKDCKLVVTTTPNMTLEFPKGTQSWSGTYDCYKSGLDYTLYVEQGVTYIITVKGAAEFDDLTLAEVDFAAGDTRELAIAVEGGKYTMDSKAPVCKWIKYVAPKDGFVTVASDAEYNPGGSGLNMNIAVNGGYATPMVSSGADYTPVFKSEVSVSEGDTVYVQITGGVAAEGKVITFAVRDAGPAETCATAIAMELTESYTVPAQNSSANYWLKAHLASGDYIIKSSASISGYSYQGLDNAKSDISMGYLGFSNYDYVTSQTLDYYMVRLTVSSEGDYYFRLGSNYSDAVVSIGLASVGTAISAPTSGTALSVAGSQLNVTADGADVAVYSLSGALVAGGRVNGTASIRLDRGLYVVKVNGKATKVTVK